MTVFEVAYLGGSRRFFSTRERAQEFTDTLARALGVGTYEFTITEHEVDAL